MHSCQRLPTSLHECTCFRNLHHLRHEWMAGRPGPYRRCRPLRSQDVGRRRVDAAPRDVRQRRLVQQRPGQDHSSLHSALGNTGAASREASWPHVRYCTGQQRRLCTNGATAKVTSRESLRRSVQEWNNTYACGGKPTGSSACGQVRMTSRRTRCCRGRRSRSSSARM